MARPKSTNATPVVENEKTTEVEQTENVIADENPVETSETKPAEKAKDKAKEKPINDDDKIVIVCAAYAGKSGYFRSTYADRLMYVDYDSIG